MKVPSLEKIFGELVVEEDTVATAKRIIEAIRSD